MDRDEFMELVYETFADEPDNVLANGIIEAADAYAEHEKAQLFSEGATSDLISRRAAVDAFEDTTFTKNEIRRRLSDLPPAQPEVLACGNGELVATPEPTDIDAKEAVYNLAEKIGIHQLFALTVELRGEPIQSELTYEQVEEYCKKRCLHVVTDDFFESTKPQRLGHWIRVAGMNECCSACNKYFPLSYFTGRPFDINYCPHCGAKMKGER